MIRRALLIASILIAFTGCTPTATKLTPVPRITLPASSAEENDYRLGIGDEIEIKFFFTPELNEKLTIGPDGKISLMFAQNIQAAGKTTDELTRIIKRKLASHMKQLDMAVIARNFASRKIYVGGEVAKAGSFQLGAHEDVLQALTEAGWLTPQASHDVILLIRRDENDDDAIYSIDIKRIMSGEDMSQNVQLLSGDLIIAPPSNQVSLDRVVDQYVRQMIPISTGVFINSR